MPMWSILHMMVTSLVVVVAPRTVKIIKNIERGEIFLQNGILTLQLGSVNRQKSCFKVRI